MPSQRNLNLIDLTSGANTQSSDILGRSAKLKAFRTVLISGRKAKTKYTLQTTTVPTRHLSSEYRSSLAKISSRSQVHQGKIRIKLTDSKTVSYKPEAPAVPDPQQIAETLRVGNYKRLKNSQRKKGLQKQTKIKLSPSTSTRSPIIKKSEHIQVQPSLVSPLTLNQQQSIESVSLGGQSPKNLIHLDQMLNSQRFQVEEIISIRQKSESPRHSKIQSPVMIGSRNRFEIKVQDSQFTQGFGQQNQGMIIDDEIMNNTQLTPPLTRMNLTRDEIGKTCGTQTADFDADNFSMFTGIDQTTKGPRPQTLGQNYQKHASDQPQHSVRYLKSRSSNAYQGIPQQVGARSKLFKLLNNSKNQQIRSSQKQSQKQINFAGSFTHKAANSSYSVHCLSTQRNGALSIQERQRKQNLNQSGARDWQQQNQQLFNFPLDSHPKPKSILTHKDNQNNRAHNESSPRYDAMSDNQNMYETPGQTQQPIAKNAKSNLASYIAKKRRNIGSTVNVTGHQDRSRLRQRRASRAGSSAETYQARQTRNSNHTIRSQISPILFTNKASNGSHAYHPSKMPSTLQSSSNQFQTGFEGQIIQGIGLMEAKAPKTEENTSNNQLKKLFKMTVKQKSTRETCEKAYGSSLNVTAGYGDTIALSNSSDEAHEPNLAQMTSNLNVPTLKKRIIIFQTQNQAKKQSGQSFTSQNGQGFQSN